MNKLKISDEMKDFLIHGLACEEKDRLGFNGAAEVSRDRTFVERLYNLCRMVVLLLNNVWYSTRVY